MDLDALHLDLILEPERLLKEILAHAMKEVGADSGSLMLLNPNTESLDIEVSVGLGNFARSTKLRLGEGVTGWVASTGQSLRVNDVTKEKRYVAVNAEIRSEMAIPLILKDQVIGVLNLDSVKKGAFSKKDEKELTELAQEAGEWIKIAWDVNQLRVKGVQLETLVDMGQVIVSESDLNDVLQRIAEESTRLMGVALGSIMLLSKDETELVLSGWHGASKEYVKRPNLRVAESLVGVVIKRQKPVTVLNVQAHAQYQQTELARKEGLVSLLSVPLVFQGRSLGALSVYTKRLHRFSNEEIRLLNAMADLSAVAIAKAKLLKDVIEAEEEMKASERLGALGWLAAEIAHEIRNPLAVVQMLFHSMVNDLDLTEEASKDAALIEKKMQQMNRILDQVLSFSRSAEPEMDWVDTEMILEDLLLLVRIKMREQKIEIRSEVGEGPLRFLGDRTQIEQAILNLVLNASQAMEPGGVLTIETGKKEIEGIAHVFIQVKDTGRGMTEEQMQAIFEPFISGRQGGTGIGLVLVKKTAESHGGKLVVHSEPGSGTTMEMAFPVSEEEFNDEA